jgi:predicted Holliday junction resolvase-like endonuclease
MQYIITIINFVKNNYKLALNAILGIIIICTILSISILSKKLEICELKEKQITQQLEYIKQLQELKQELSDKAITKNTVEYKDRVVYIQAKEKNASQDNCSNAIALLRTAF